MDDDPNMIDEIFSYPFPEEFNQARVRRIFQNLERHKLDDLKEELNVILKYAKSKVNLL